MIGREEKYIIFLEGKGRYWKFEGEGDRGVINLYFMDLYFIIM